VRPGVSIGHVRTTAGTLGAIVQRTGERFLLSNNHVLALLNQAQVGDPILQPGPGDGGTLNQTVGELVGFEPIRFIDEGSAQVVVIDDAPASPEPKGCAALVSQLFGRKPGPSSTSTPRTTTVNVIPENRVDAAIARPYNGTAIDARILDFGTAPLGIAEPRLGMAVFKSGRTSGFTEGFITQVDVTVDVEYSSRKARYVNQMMITPFSKRGDSGSLVLNGDRRAVGLIFAGSDLISVACPIRYVLAALKVELAAS
jgi:hypothetical protein